MRKKIAEHMILSRRTSAHVTTVYEIDMSKVAKLREENRKSFEDRTGTKLTFMPFIFKAVTDAIRKFPVFNSQVSGDQIIYKRDINLGMAVALDCGLIVPVIKRADDLSISGLARAANDLAESEIEGGEDRDAAEDLEALLDGDQHVVVGCAHVVRSVLELLEAL